MKLAIGTANNKPFTLPIDAVTETFAILAKKGYGKSYTSDVLIEELLTANQQVVIIDPTGAHWGLQSTANGKEGAFPVVIFGGDHQNIPLEENAGEIISRAIVEKRFSAILDLSHFRKGVANRFVGIFLETLYRLNREPLMLIVDEADSYAPQRGMGDEMRTLGAMEDIVKKGRIRGIGCTLITQRPQTINKNVLSQVDTLICGNLSHPKDIKAIEEWVDVHADPKEAKAMVESLPVLPKGTLWFWSPSWGGFFDKVKVRERTTFNSGATPKPGEKIRAPQKLAPVDIDALGKTIAETVERKNADDPKLLKKRIAELENEKKKWVSGPTTKANSVTITADNAKAYEGIVVRAVAARDKHWQSEITNLTKAIERMKRLLTEGRNKINDGLGIEIPGVVQPEKDIAEVRTEKPAIPIRQQEFVRQPSPAPKIRTEGDGTLARCERAILVVLATHGVCTQNKAAIISGYSSSSGGFKNSLSKLRSSGFILGGGDAIRITPDGETALGQYDPLPTGSDLHEFWYRKLAKAERAILRALIDRSSEMSKDEIAEATGYSATSGGFKNSLSRLRTLELIEGYGNIKAADALFE